MLTAALAMVMVPWLTAGAGPGLDGGSALVSVLTGDTSDVDGDGILDAAELLLGTDPAWDDTDGDGLPDGYELWNGLDPLDAFDAADDTDRDGLDNAEEYAFGTLPFDPDTDGDRFWDGVEVLRETDPLVNWSFPSPRRRGDVDCDGIVNAMDVQLVLNGALGLEVPVPVNTDYVSSINAADVQVVINAVCGYL